ncbi:hypothetical protein KSD_61980 [Ktedonobacter sp. SOSP1-85]|uniref:hypothetical protein n=1 Tax=Ktedonobacter sp. SOSP1-85 TaxID=2778367 RepID=UPI001915383A|nr:hypothetical protein [Ktedonobacter sp. SOSP1-85]GHO78427.1 hypothetical protein KSD_61980 [Ktedonobacter sp. SOSP1-85]
MRPQTLPPGYAIVHFGDEWYPLEATVSHPLGTPIAYGILDDECEYMHFSRPQDAVQACQVHWEQEQARDCQRWERMAAHRESHPDRCVHYHDEIVAITGKEPLISPYSTAKALVGGYWCRFCGYHSLYTAEGQTEEEALAKAAEHAYATRCRCAESVEAPEHTLHAITLHP